MAPTLWLAGVQRHLEGFPIVFAMLGLTRSGLHLLAIFFFYFEVAVGWQVAGGILSLAISVASVVVEVYKSRKGDLYLKQLENR